MSLQELLMATSILVGLAIVRFGLPLTITWLLGKVLGQLQPRLNPQ
jgi:hypothetical protein